MGWFNDLTGLAADDPATVRAGIAVEGPFLHLVATGARLRWGSLATPRLDALPPPPPTAPARLRVREVVADVRALHADPAHAGAVFQVASQFNLLEMVSPGVTPESGIARYAHDLTQGPACAMACAAGTIWRNYFVPVQGGVGQTAAAQLDMLDAVGAALGNDGGRLWRMQNGYLLPRPGGLAEAARHIAGQEAVLRGMVRVGVQQDTQVTLPGCAHQVTQVYCSAVPMAYTRETEAAWEPLARLVLEAAYLATLAVAWQTAQATGQRRVFLTRLGGGAFGNPGAWITAAMATALAGYAGCDLEVAIVSFGRADPANKPLLRG